VVVNDRAVVFVDSAGHEERLRACAHGARKLPISWCWSWPPMTASCRKRKKRSTTQSRAKVPIIVAINKIDKAEAQLVTRESGNSFCHDRRGPLPSRPRPRFQTFLGLFLRNLKHHLLFQRDNAHHSAERLGKCRGRRHIQRLVDAGEYAPVEQVLSEFLGAHIQLFSKFANRDALVIVTSRGRTRLPAAR